MAARSPVLQHFGPGRRLIGMRRFGWIWFIGCAVWLMDGAVSVHFRSWQHAEVAFLLALVFLAAGLLYRRPSR